MIRQEVLTRARPLAIVIAVLLVAVAALSTTLAALALRRPATVVAPGVRESRIVVPDQVPDAAAVKFALLYLYHFDNYTPLDVEERSNWVLRFVDPEHQELVAKSLSERASYVLRAREASQLTLPLPGRCEIRREGGGLLRFSGRARRRIYIAGELKSEEWVRYWVDLRPALPSDDDAYGFQVVGQSIRPESGKDAEGEKGR